MIGWLILCVAAGIVMFYFFLCLGASGVWFPDQAEKRRLLTTPKEQFLMQAKDHIHDMEDALDPAGGRGYVREQQAIILRHMTRLYRFAEGPLVNLYFMVFCLEYGHVWWKSHFHPDPKEDLRRLLGWELHMAYYFPR